MPNEIVPLVGELGRCAEDMQRLLDALNLRYHEDYRVRDAAVSLHGRLSQIKLQALNQKLKAAGR